MLLKLTLNCMLNLYFKGLLLTHLPTKTLFVSLQLLTKLTNQRQVKRELSLIFGPDFASLPMRNPQNSLKALWRLRRWLLTRNSLSRPNKGELKQQKGNWKMSLLKSKRWVTVNLLKIGRRTPYFNSIRDMISLIVKTQTLTATMMITFGKGERLRELSLWMKLGAKHGTFN